MAMGGSYQGTTGPKGWSFSKGSRGPPNGWGEKHVFCGNSSLDLCGRINSMRNQPEALKTHWNFQQFVVEVNHPEVRPTLRLSHTIGNIRLTRYSPTSDKSCPITWQENLFVTRFWDIFPQWNGSTSSKGLRIVFHKSKHQMEPLRLMFNIIL
jgi:hypothetical protein